MSDVERLKSKVYTEQLNVWVDAEMKRRILRLKQDHRVNVSSEIRKAIAAHVSQLEQAVGA